MGPLYPPSHLHCIQSFEAITIVEQTANQLSMKEVYFIGEQEGKFTLLDESKGFVDVDIDGKTRFLVGHGHSPDQVQDRYFRELQDEQKQERLNELEKTLKHRKEPDREPFERLF